MDQSVSPGSTSLKLLEIDEICERFEDGLRGGGTPRLEESLPANWPPGDRLQLLEYLLRVELEYRLQSGQTVSADEYRSRFPECAGTIADLLQRTARHLLPKEIGPYRIVDRLGTGGMGEVYKAFQPRLNRFVAVKVLPAALLSQPGARRRFDREMQAVGQVAHPNIVTAFDAGQTEDVHYLVMELVEGFSLAEISRRLGPLDTACACELIRQASVGLAQVHRAGLVHRDIKPGNLMLGPGGQVKVLDLGLALLQERPAAEEGSELTEADQMMGTLDYMAPEQCIDSHRVDAKADLYALGATLYRLLTGRVPFARRGAVTTVGRLSAKLREVCTPLRELRADLPAPLAALVEQLLSRDFADRPASAEEVVRRLAPYCGSADLTQLLERAGHTPASEAASDTATRGITVHDRRATATVKPNPPTPQGTPAAESSGGWTTFPWRVALACGGAAVLLLAAVILLLPTKEGATIQFEIADPQLRISVADGEYTIDDDGQQIKLSAGKHALSVCRGDLQFDAATFTLKRGDVVRLKVSYLNEKVFLARDGNIQELRAVQPLASREPAPAALMAWTPTVEQQAYFDAVALLSEEAKVASVVAKLRKIAGNEEFTWSAHFDPQWETREGKAVSFQIDAWTVYKLWPLVALSELESLDMVGTTVTDFRPLTKLPLVDLKVELALFNTGAEKILREIPTLKSINGVAAKDFFARRGEQRAEIDEFARRARAANLALASVFEWTEPRMRYLNPNMPEDAKFVAAGVQPGDSRISFEDGRLLIWRGGEIHDLSALRVLPLARIKMHGRNSQGGPHIYDLSPLAGLPIAEISLHGTPLADLSPLRDMPLKKLSISNSMLEDLSPLSGSQLESLDCAASRVKDLSPLKDLPLTYLDVSRTRVRDLSPLSGMQLTTLICDQTGVTDLSPLAGMPLRHLSVAHGHGASVADLAPLADMPLDSINLNLRVDFRPDEELLRSLPLKTINGMTPAMFWEGIEAIRADRQKEIDSTKGLALDERVKKIAEFMAAEKMVAEFLVEEGKVTQATIRRAGNHYAGSLWPLLALPELRHITLAGVDPRLDLSPLMRLKVESLAIDLEPADEAALIALNRAILRAMTSLKSFNGQPAAALR